MTEVVQLFREVATGSLRGVQQTLAQNPALLTARDTRTAQTPLHAAALLGHTEIIRELLARGFSHEAHDRQGNLPLHLAAAKGDAGAVRELTGRGMEFSVRAKNREGQTPLHLAARGWHPAAAHELLKAGARPGTTDKEGRTALDLAGSHEELRQMLSALQTSFPSLLGEPDLRSFRAASDTSGRSGSGTSSPRFIAPLMQSDSGILSERSGNLSSVTRAKANAILDQARAKDSRVKVLHNEFGENLPRQDSSGSGRSSTSHARGSQSQSFHDRMGPSMEGQRATASVGTQAEMMDQSQFGRLTEHEQRLGAAEGNLRELRLAIDRISDRLRAACLRHERDSPAGEEPIDQAHGLLGELSNRVALLETRLALASPSAQSVASKRGFAEPAAHASTAEATTVLQSNALYADSSGSTQESSGNQDPDVARTALARVEVSMEQHRILVEEQGMLLRQVENRVEMIMKALEERASEMLQGASQGSSGASISEMLGHEMDRVQQALEHRFSRIETDIETLIQQEWKISAAADAAAERQIQARFGEQVRQFREQEDRLAALQRRNVEDEMGRRGYEALMQQLQQGMSALGSRLAMLESRDTGNVPQASVFGDSRSDRLLTGSSLASSQHALNEVMHSDVVISPRGSRPSSRQGREDRQHPSARDQMTGSVMAASHASVSRPNQPPSRMRPVNPEPMPYSSMPDPSRPRQDLRHPSQQQYSPAEDASGMYEQPGMLPMADRAHAGDLRDYEQPAGQMYGAPAATLQGLPPGEPRLQGGVERGRHSRRGSHRRDRSRSRDERGIHGEGSGASQLLYPETSDGQRRDSGRHQPGALSQPSASRPLQDPYPTSRSALESTAYDSEGRQHFSYEAASSVPEQAAGPSRPRMQPLPEEDIQAEERDQQPPTNATASLSKQQRLSKRLSKPGNSCKGCIIS